MLLFLRRRRSVCPVTVWQTGCSARLRSSIAASTRHEASQSLAVILNLFTALTSDGPSRVSQNSQSVDRIATHTHTHTHGMSVEPSESTTLQLCLFYHCTALSARTRSKQCSIQTLRQCKENLGDTRVKKMLHFEISESGRVDNKSWMTMALA